MINESLLIPNQRREAIMFKYGPDTHGTPEVIKVPVKEIYSDVKFNCRGMIPESNVVELARDINTRGLLQPITVQPYVLHPPHRYRVVIGHRRLAAYRQLEWVEIPAIIKEGLSDIDAQTLNLVENINRQDLNLLQEAKAIEKFRVAGLSLDDIANRLRKSKAWLNIRFTLLKLHPEIQNAAAGGVLTQEQVLDIAKLKVPELQFEAIKKIKESRIRGEKRAMKIVKPKKNLLKRKERNRAERTEMLGHILDTIGPCVATRILAWTNGDISTLELHRDLESFAKDKGIHYSIPDQLFEEGGPSSDLLHTA